MERNAGRVARRETPRRGRVETSPLEVRHERLSEVLRGLFGAGACSVVVARRLVRHGGWQAVTADVGVCDGRGRPLALRGGEEAWWAAREEALSLYGDGHWTLAEAASGVPWS